MLVPAISVLSGKCSATARLEQISRKASSDKSLGRLSYRSRVASAKELSKLIHVWYSNKVARSRYSLYSNRRDVKFIENWLFLVCKWLVFCSHVSEYVKMISLFTALFILWPVCNVRRIFACLCLPVALAWRLFLIVLITVTRPRVIDGMRFFGNSAYFGECCFLRVIETYKCQYTVWGPGGGPIAFGRRVGLCSTRLI